MDLKNMQHDSLLCGHCMRTLRSGGCKLNQVNVKMTLCYLEATAKLLHVDYRKSSSRILEPLANINSSMNRFSDF